MLSIPMLGDSFCKLALEEHYAEHGCFSFNPHAWGLFLQVGNRMGNRMGNRTFNPHAWGLFLQVRMLLMLSFLGVGPFNPHAWGLFLQGGRLVYHDEDGEYLSIPMLGDSFCK